MGSRRLAPCSCSDALLSFHGIKLERRLPVRVHGQQAPRLLQLLKLRLGLQLTLLPLALQPLLLALFHLLQYKCRTMEFDFRPAATLADGTPITAAAAAPPASVPHSSRWSRSFTRSNGVSKDTTGGARQSWQSKVRCCHMRSKSLRLKSSRIQGKQAADLLYGSASEPPCQPS